MSSVENTIGMGLSKIQDGLDKGKNKVELICFIFNINLFGSNSRSQCF